MIDYIIANSPAGEAAAAGEDSGVTLVEASAVVDRVAGQMRCWFFL